jgi:hypothetical protein
MVQITLAGLILLLAAASTSTPPPEGSVPPSGQEKQTEVKPCLVGAAKCEDLAKEPVAPCNATKERPCGNDVKPLLVNPPKPEPTKQQR